MKVITDDIWLCPDCMIFAVNGDLPADTGIARDMEIEDGVARLGQNLVPDFGEQPRKFECDECATTFDEIPDNDECPVCLTGAPWDITRDNGEDEFSLRECDACGTHLAGTRYRFAILGEEK